MSRASRSWRDSVRQACATSACRLGNSNTTRRSLLSPVRYLVADSDGDIDPDMEGLTEAEEEAHQDYLIAVDKWNLLSVHTALHKKRP